MKIATFRIRDLDKEIEHILDEADGRCSTAFALRLDDLREKLSPSLEALAKSQGRIARKHADKDGKNNPKPDEKGHLKYSTADQQEALSVDMIELLKAEIDISDDLPKIRKSELIANGLATSGTRIAALRPILDLALDEPGSIDDTAGDRHFTLGSERRVPNA